MTREEGIALDTNLLLDGRTGVYSVGKIAVRVFTPPGFEPRVSRLYYARKVNESERRE